MSVDNWTDDLASVVRYALATTRATAICPFHENVTIASIVDLEIWPL